ncbi:MAG: hypothetical protein PHG03_05765 [Bacilli bacterium]|nr:hypothetical protein [Bacilli bacterium]MDD4796039.1 hypothetical protein [Bacilli bacterium]
MKSNLSPSRFIFLILIISILVTSLVRYYGGYFKDAITKATCPITNSEYEGGDSSGEGKCIIPAGMFD